MSHVFISYSHKDDEYTKKLVLMLEAQNIPLWIDARIDYGSRWSREIQENLDKSGAFLVIMSPHSYESEWVQNELARAQSKKISLFPILLEGEVWLSVQSTQCFYAIDKKLPDEDFCNRIKNVLSETKINVDSPNIQGQWVDESTGHIAYYKQTGIRIIGFYDFGLKQKKGLYTGYIKGTTLDYKWRWLDGSYEGEGRLELSQYQDRKTLSGFWWHLGKRKETFKLEYTKISNSIPDWLTEKDFKEYSK